MQKLKYYTVCLTLSFIGVFLSYPNISLSQSYNYNIEASRIACEKYGGIYIEVDDVGRYNQCILDSSYNLNILAEDCVTIGGTFDFEANECRIEPETSISLERYCISANGQWRNGNCVFDISNACTAAKGYWNWDNDRCDFSARTNVQDLPFFTDELRREIEQGNQYEGLHTVIFYVDASFDVSIADSIPAKFRGYDRETYRERIYRVMAGTRRSIADTGTSYRIAGTSYRIADTSLIAGTSYISGTPGICLHPSAQQGEDWDSSQGPCVDPSGNPITLEEQETVDPLDEEMADPLDEEMVDPLDEEMVDPLIEQVPQETSDSIWIIFSEDDSHGFKFTRVERTVEGRVVHYYELETIVTRDVDNNEVREVQWRNSSYTVTDEEGNLPPSSIRLRYVPTSVREFNIEERDITQLPGVNP